MDIIDFFLMPFIHDHLEEKDKSKSKESKINLFFDNLTIKDTKSHSATSQTMRIEKSNLSGLLPIEQFYITGETGQIRKKEKFYIFRLTLDADTKELNSNKQLYISNKRQSIYDDKKNKIVELLKTINKIQNYKEDHTALCGGPNEVISSVQKKLNINCNYDKINVLLVFRICNDKLIIQYRGVIINNKFYSQNNIQVCENDNKEYEDIEESQPVDEMNDSAFEGFGSASESNTDPVIESEFDGFGPESSNTDPNEYDYSGFEPNYKEQSVGGGRKRTRKNRNTRRKRTRKNKKSKIKKTKRGKTKKTRRLRR
jgi:hypothetical protein